MEMTEELILTVMEDEDIDRDTAIRFIKTLVTDYGMNHDNYVDYYIDYRG